MVGETYHWLLQYPWGSGSPTDPSLGTPPHGSTNLIKKMVTHFRVAIFKKFVDAQGGILSLWPPEPPGAA